MYSLASLARLLPLLAQMFWKYLGLVGKKTSLKIVFLVLQKEHRLLPAVKSNLAAVFPCSFLFLRALASASRYIMLRLTLSPSIIA